MSYMQQAKKPGVQAPILTVSGSAGVGKSTLAGLFPAPYIIQAENATTIYEDWDEDLQPMCGPEIPPPCAAKGIRPSVVVLDQLRELYTEEHPYKTVVIDSITSMNQLIEREIVEYYRDKDGKMDSNIAEAEGGFAKGFHAVAELHRKVMDAVQHLRRKGLGIILLSHTGIDKIKNRPDSEPYTIFTLDMHLYSRVVYIPKSDSVLFMRSREYVTGVEMDRKGRVTKLGKIRATSERYIETASEGTMGVPDAKNRYRLPAQLLVAEGENPLLEYIPFYRQQQVGE